MQNNVCPQTCYKASSLGFYFNIRNKVAADFWTLVALRRCLGRLTDHVYLFPNIKVEMQLRPAANFSRVM